MLAKFGGKTELIFYIFLPPPVQKTFLRHCPLCRSNFVT